jgi:hypothetical protein
MYLSKKFARVELPGCGLPKVWHSIGNAKPKFAMVAAAVIVACEARAAEAMSLR